MRRWDTAVAIIILVLNSAWLGESEPTNNRHLSLSLIDVVFFVSVTSGSSQQLRHIEVTSKH